MDVSVQGQWVGYRDCAECDHELSIREEGEDWCCAEARKCLAEDVWNRVSDDNPKGAHA